MNAITMHQLEPTLRLLANNGDIKVGAAAARHLPAGVKLGDFVPAIWSWLKQHNGSKRDLTNTRIDTALASQTEAKTSPVGAKQRVEKAIERMIVRPAARAADSAPNAPTKFVGPTDQLDRWLRDQELKPLTDVLSYQVCVTPPLAQQWLTLNSGNRNPSKAKIRRFAAAIKAGRWVQNGETVKFSITGRLLDGQSRLKAIIMAGTPAVLEIRAGLPDAAQQSMDIGEARKGTHTLEMLGEKYPSILSPALRYVYRWECGTLSGNKFGEPSVLENMEIAPLLKKHQGIGASVGWCVGPGHKVAGMMPPSEVAFFHYLFGRASTAKRDSFFAALATGLGLSATRPAYHLRERLQADRAGSARMDKRERFALLIKAWNAHHTGAKLNMLVFRSTGASREAFPEISGVKGGK